MGIGSGLGGQLGIGVESAYGSYHVPTVFLEYTKEKLQEKKTTATSGGIAASRLVDLSSRRVVTQREVKGTIDLEVTTAGFGLLFQGLMGTTVTPAQIGSTAAYKQTHNLTDSFGKNLSVQKGVPLTTGTVKPYSAVGCKILSGEFSCEAGGMLTATFEIDGKAMDQTQTIAAPSYPALLPFDFSQMAVSLGAYGSEASLTGIRKMSVKIERPMAVDRFYAGGGGLKVEPIANGKVKITGTIEQDHVATTLSDLFTSDGGTSLIWAFTGAPIDTEFASLKFQLPVIKVDDEPPTVEGPDVVKTSYSFTGMFDGSHANKIEYISTDTSL